MTDILLITSSPRSAGGLSSRFATEIAEGLKAHSGATLTAPTL
jgi:FMN-dependent NADH-azoreductase